jgi:hypothetical protein
LAPVLRAENEEGGFQPVAFFTAENVCERSEQGVVMGLQKDLATRREAAGASVDLQSAATALVEWAVAPVIDELMKQHQSQPGNEKQSWQIHNERNASPVASRESPER